MPSAQLRWQPIAVLLALALVWGANMAIIKIGSRELAPLFMAGLRSLVASLCLYAWMKFKRIDLFPSKIVLLHGIVIGLFFGAEFGRASPLQTLFYQVFFSAPLLFALSIALENPVVSALSWTGGFSVFYQCIIIAFLSYLVWFELVSRYPVSLLHAFTFFTPVFGVLISGIIIMDEPISSNLVAALIMVCLGMVLVNYRPTEETAAPADS